MTTGLKISASAHALLLIAVAIGWPFASRLPPDPPSVVSVSLVASEDLAAADVQPEPELEPPAPPREVPDSMAALPPPPSALPDTSTPLTPDTSPTVGAPAPQIDRIAPVAAPRPPEPVPDAPAPQAQAIPEPTPEPEVAQPQDAEAPQEAVRESVPETREDAVATQAPGASPRPAERPEPPAPQRQAGNPDTDAAVDNAINRALQDALSAPEDPAPAPAPAAPVGPPLTAADREGLALAVARCWNFSSLSTDAARVTVVVSMTMTRDGKPRPGSLAMLSFEGGGAAAAQQAFETARRAILRCQGDGYPLPPEKYAHWSEIQITFNPERMRQR